MGVVVFVGAYKERGRRHFRIAGISEIFREVSTRKFFARTDSTLLKEDKLRMTLEKRP
jgi:hypothetical protein